MSSLASSSAVRSAPAGSSAVRAETIQALRRQLVSAQQTQSSQRVIPTGLKSLDRLLPGGGLPTSALIEWISDEVGQTAASVALRAVAPLLSLPGCLAVIDERHDFHGNAAISLVMCGEFPSVMRRLCGRWSSRLAMPEFVLFSVGSIERPRR